MPACGPCTTRWNASVCAMVLSCEQGEKCNAHRPFAFNFAALYTNSAMLGSLFAAMHPHSCAVHLQPSPRPLPFRGAIFKSPLQEGVRGADGITDMGRGGVLYMVCLSQQLLKWPCKGLQRHVVPT